MNDDASAEVLQALREVGVELILMRCAGFDKERAAHSSPSRVAHRLRLS